MSESNPTVTCVLPSVGEVRLESLKEVVAQARLGMPFDASSRAFVEDLSHTLLADKAMRRFPEFMALAHWFRPSRLNELRGRLGPVIEGRTIAPRGLVFHVAPSNVDSVFVYSWLLALLCGNASIVRVSRRISPAQQEFLATASRVLATGRHGRLAGANIVVTYEHDDAVSAAMSSLCQLRVVWGGDATVSYMRSIPIPPLSCDLAFPNRFSLAVLRARRVAELAAKERGSLVSRFFNDAFQFGQQACSSPRVIVWVGESHEIRDAQASFWEALMGLIALKSPENSAPSVMRRVLSTFRVAQCPEAAELRSSPGHLPARIAAHGLSEHMRRCHDGDGIFIEIHRTSLSEVPDLLSPLDQTISSFGFLRSDWISILDRVPAHAADRVVPVGSALEFDTVWDGQDLLRAFTREIAVSDGEL
jgi:hypothetical protein